MPGVTYGLGLAMVSREEPRLISWSGPAQSINLIVSYARGVPSMYAKIERIRIGIGLINRNKANTYVSSRTLTLCITYKLMRLAVPEIPAQVRGRLAAVSSLLLGDRSDHIVCIFTSPSRGL